VANALWDLISKISHIYLDNIIIWSSSIKEHQIHVWQVLTCLHQHGLGLNSKKYEFFLTKVDFLGGNPANLLVHHPCPNNPTNTLHVP
jgi:hypothetical protein